MTKEEQDQLTIEKLNGLKRWVEKSFPPEANSIIPQALEIVSQHGLAIKALERNRLLDEVMELIEELKKEKLWDSKSVGSHVLAELRAKLESMKEK